MDADGFHNLAVLVPCLFCYLKCY